MTSDLSDPTRIQDDGPEALRELVCARREGPSAAAVGKMAERLAAAGVIGAAADGGRGSEKKLAYSKLAGVLVIASGLLLAWRVTRAPATAARAPAETPSAAEPAARKVSEIVTADRPTMTAVSVDELPSAALAPAGNAPSAKSPVARGGSNRSATELELVQRAEASLASDPGRALASAGEHARAFPSGEFVQEREVIAVDALSRLGRKEEALHRARSLVQRFPRTPYAARLARAVGQPVAPTNPDDPASSPAAPAR